VCVYSCLYNTALISQYYKYSVTKNKQTNKLRLYYTHMRLQEFIIINNNDNNNDFGGSGDDLSRDGVEVEVVVLQDSADNNHNNNNNNNNNMMSRRQFGLKALAGVGAGLAGVSTEAGAAQHQIDQIVQLHPRARLLYEWARRYIRDVRELAAFMSQCAHESDNFATVEEYGTPEQFLRRYDVQYNPRKARDLGNTEPGDGARFHGRGYIQLTGRWNYQAAGEWLTQLVGRPIDLTAHPELIAQPTGAALASLWYWKTFSRPRVKNFNNTPEVTRTINPALAGEQNRERKHAEWRRDLGVRPDPSAGKTTRQQQHTPSPTKTTTAHSSTTTTPPKNHSGGRK